MREFKNKLFQSDITLIECVRQHVELYDISNKKYNDTSNKRRIWRNISKHLGYSEKECKMRWTNIRGGYRKSLKRRMERSSLHLNMKYIYEDQLIFLLPFIKIKMNPNHLSPIREDDEVSTAKETPLVKRDDNHDLQTRPADSKVTEDEADRLHGEESVAGQERTVQREIPIKNEPRLIIPELTSWNYSAESNDLNLRVTSSVSHSVDVFLATIAPILKSLSPSHLNIAMTKISSVVQEEMTQIAETAEAAPGLGLRAPIEFEFKKKYAI